MTSSFSRDKTFSFSHLSTCALQLGWWIIRGKHLFIHSFSIAASLVGANPLCKGQVRVQPRTSHHFIMSMFSDCGKQPEKTDLEKSKVHLERPQDQNLTRNLFDVRWKYEGVKFALSSFIICHVMYGFSYLVTSRFILKPCPLCLCQLALPAKSD